MSVVVVPLSTSPSQARRGPTTVAIPADVAGLSRATSAICHQVTTLDRMKLTARIGMLPTELLQQVNNGLKAALDLD
jgi:mRNA interferase MazF